MTMIVMLTTIVLAAHRLPATERFGQHLPDAFSPALVGAFVRGGFQVHRPGAEIGITITIDIVIIAFVVIFMIISMDIVPYLRGEAGKGEDAGKEARESREDFPLGLPLAR